jgi:putative endonuclease
LIFKIDYYKKDGERKSYWDVFFHKTIILKSRICEIAENRLKMVFFVYILKCSDDTLYVGVTTNIERRIVEHNGSKRGAKYTRGRRPVILIYKAPFENRSEAQKREYSLKQLTKEEKLAFIAQESRHSTVC